jgi:hypothetical protein
MPHFSPVCKRRFGFELMKMKLTNAAANITVQVSTSRPEKCEGRRYAQGECCCQDHCEVNMHYSARVKMVDAVLKAVEVVDIYGPELDDLDEQASTWGLGGLFASTQLDVEAVLGQSFRV